MTKNQKRYHLVSHSSEETIRAGKKLAATLQNGDLILLSGPLGAGKTTFIKGIAEELQINRDDVKSPSFTIANEYPGRIPLFHLDLYRIDDVSELYQIGWDDFLRRDGVVVVEWGEKAQAYIPAKRIQVMIEIISETDRNLIVDFIEDELIN